MQLQGPAYLAVPLYPTHAAPGHTSAPLPPPQTSYIPDEQPHPRPSTSSFPINTDGSRSCVTDMQRREPREKLPWANSTPSGYKYDADDDLWQEWMTDEFVQTASTHPAGPAPLVDLPVSETHVKPDRGFLHMLDTNLMADNAARFPRGAHLEAHGGPILAKRTMASGGGGSHARIAKRARTDHGVSGPSAAERPPSRKAGMPHCINPPPAQIPVGDSSNAVHLTPCPGNLTGPYPFTEGRQPDGPAPDTASRAKPETRSPDQSSDKPVPTLPPLHNNPPIKERHLLKWAPTTSTYPPSHINARYIDYADFSPVHDLHHQGLRLHIKFFHKDVIMQRRTFTAFDIDRAMSKISNRLLFIASVRRRYVGLAQVEPLDMLDQIMQEQQEHFKGLEVRGEPYKPGRAHSGTDCNLSRTDWIDFIHTAYIPLNTLRNAVYTDKAIAFADQATIVGAAGTLILLRSLAGRPVDVRELEFAYSSDGLVEGDTQEWAVEQVVEYVETTRLEGLLVVGEADQTKEGKT